MVCPNINTPEWKLLEKQVGTKEAYRAFNANNNEIPIARQPVRIKKDTGFKEVVPTKNDIGRTRNTLVHYNMENNTSHFIDASPVARGYKLDLVLNYLPFGVFEQMKLDSANRNFIETIPIKGAKVVQLNVNFDVNPVNPEDILKQIEKEADVLVKASTPMRHRVYGGMYALNTEDTAVASDELTGKLIEILQKNGIQVRNGIENLKTRKGLEVPAIADLVNNLILVAKGTRESDVLPEEAAHFVIGTMDPNSELYQQLTELIVKTPEYEGVVEKYSAEYDGDIVALKEEALGKLLAKQFIKVYQQQQSQVGDPKIIKLIKNLWQRIKRAMGRIVYPKYQADLETLLGKTAEGILNEKSRVNTSNQAITRQREMYNLTGKMSKVDTSAKIPDPEPVIEDDRQTVPEPEPPFLHESLERKPLSPEEKIRIEGELNKLLNNMIRQLEKRKKIIKSSSGRSKQEIQIEQDRIRQLEKHLDEMTFLAATEKYLTQALEDINGKDVQVKGKFSVLPVNEYHSGALQALAAIEFELAQGTVQDINELARKIRDIHGFIVSYKENIKKIRSLMSDLKTYDQDDAFIKNIDAYLSEVNDKISEVETKYYDIGADIFAKFLGNYLGNRNKTEELEKLDIKLALKQAERDIGFFQLWANAMAESGDDVLKLIDSAVKAAKYTGQYEARLDQKDLQQAQEELEKSGTKDVKFVYEKDKEGNITGNLTSQYGINYGDFWEARDKYRNNVLGERPVRDDYKTDSDFNTAVSEWKAKERKWDEENTEAVPDAQAIIDGRKIPAQNSETANFNYQMWIDQNFEKTIEGSIETGLNLGEGYESMSPKNLGTMRMPKRSRYKDSTYANLNLAQKIFLDEVWKVKRKNDTKMNPKFVRPQQAPMIRKDMVETIKTAKTAADAKKGLQRIKEHFVRTEDEVDFGGQELPDETEERIPGAKYVYTDVRGRLVRFLPVFFTKKLKDMNDLSLDIVATMSAHSAMTNDYHEMEKIIHLLEVGKDYITDQRKVPINPNWFESITGRKNEEGEPTKERAPQEQGMSNIAKRLEGYFDMQVYGNYKKDEGTILGGLDTAKLIDAMGSYVAINNLALNVYAGFANVLFGTANIRVEAAAGEHFKHKDLLYADKVYTRDLPAMLGEMGVRNKKSKLALFTEFFDTLQDFEQDIMSMNTTRHTRMSQMATMSSLFFLNHAGEHYMQTRTALAMAHQVKLKDKAGNEVPLYDAMEVRKNKLVLKSEFEGQFNTEDLVKFRKKTNGINQFLHGIYNKLDKSYMQQRSYLRLILMFRKFLIPAINRRYGRKTYNYQTEVVTEGYYRATWNFMAGLYRDVKQGQFSITKNWKDLTPREKSNFMRTFYELGYMLAFLTLATILVGMAEDDDDWILNMMAYQAHRVFTEFAAYVPLPGFMPTEGLRIIKSPAAAVNQLTMLNNALVYAMPWEWGEEMKSGQYKGKSKFYRYGVDILPLHRTVKKLATPEESLKFFTKPVY